MRRHVRWILFLVLAGCGAPGWRLGATDGNTEKAARAALVDGDLDRALSILEDAHSSDTVAGCYLRGDILDSTGRPAEALEAYLEALRISHSDGSSPISATASAMGVVAIRDRVDGFDGVLARFLERTGGLPGLLPPEAAFQLRNLALGLAMKRGDPRKVKARLDETGCLTEWAVAGPFGPNVWETFDRGPMGQERPDPRERWPRVVNLGPGRGMSEIDVRRSATCAVVPADRSFPVEGVSQARASIILDEAARVLFRLDTVHSARVYAGGVLVHERDTRGGWPPTVSWFSADLERGATDITIELANPAGPPSFSLAAIDEHGDPIDTSSPSSSSAVGRATPVGSEPAAAATDLTSTLASLRSAIWWDDRDAAARLLRHLAELSPRSPLTLEIGALAALGDRSVPSEVTFERARALMEEALEIDPKMLQSRLFLSSVESSDGHPDLALRLVEDGSSLAPREPLYEKRKAEISTSMGWTAETLDAVESLAGMMPSSCVSLSWKLVAARMRSRFDEALEIAGKIRECDAYSTALAEELTRAQRFEEALVEQERIASMRPDEASYVNDVSLAALAAGDLEAHIEGARRALALAPDNPEVVVRIADSMIALGMDGEASGLIEANLARLPGPQPILERAASTIAGKDLFSDLRLDGLALISSYERQEDRYDTSSVWVLDRAVHLVNRDGSRTEIVHSIAHLKTDEAIEAHGELSVPPGAILLTARTVKKDGRVLEPEEVPNKGTISFPDLQAGDFIESEFASFFGPSPMFPGGFDTERFYFQDFDTAFHRSEMILITPVGMEVQTDPRGDCPQETISKRGDLVIRTWRARGDLPRNREPGGPAPSEYLPSIRALSEGGWGAVCARIRDLTADKARPTDTIAETLERLSPARKIYHHLMREVDETGDLFEQASHAIERGSGNRARTFAALMRADGRSARMGLVRPLGSDDTVTDLPSLEILDRVVILLDNERWISFDQDGAPFGYLPPELRNRPVLLVDSCEFSTTNGGATPGETTTIEVDIAIDGSGNATAAIKETLSGMYAAAWRSNLEQVSKAQLAQRFQEDYLSKTIEGAVLASLEIDGRDDPEADLVLSYTVAIHGFARPVDSTMKATLPFSSNLQQDIGGLPARSTPVIIPSGDATVVDYSVAVPAGWIFETVGDSRLVDTRHGTAEVTGVVEGNLMMVKARTALHVGRVPASQYTDLLEFAGEADTLSRVEITFYPQETHNNLTR